MTLSILRWRIATTIATLCLVLAGAGLAYGAGRASAPTPKGVEIKSQSRKDLDARLYIARVGAHKLRLTTVRGDGTRASIVVWSGDLRAVTQAIFPPPR